MKIIKDLCLEIFDIDARQLRPKNFYKGVNDYRNKILPKHRHLIKKQGDYTCALCNGVKGSLFLEWIEVRGTNYIIAIHTEQLLLM